MEMKWFKGVLVLVAVVFGVALSDAAPVQFIVTGTANSSAFGYTEGEAYAFAFTFNEDYTGGTGDEFTSIMNEWDPYLSTDSQLFANFAGDGLTGEFVPKFPSGQTDDDRAEYSISVEKGGSDADEFMIALSTESISHRLGVSANGTELTHVELCVYSSALIDELNATATTYQDPNDFWSQYAGTYALESSDEFFMGQYIDGTNEWGDQNEDRITFTPTSLTIISASDFTPAESLVGMQLDIPEVVMSGEFERGVQIYFVNASNCVFGSDYYARSADEYLYYEQTGRIIFDEDYWIQLGDDQVEIGEYDEDTGIYSEAMWTCAASLHTNLTMSIGEEWETLCPDFTSESNSTSWVEELEGAASEVVYSDSLFFNLYEADIGDELQLNRLIPVASNLYLETSLFNYNNQTSEWGTSDWYNLDANEIGFDIGLYNSSTFDEILEMDVTFSPSGQLALWLDDDNQFSCYARTMACEGSDEVILSMIYDSGALSVLFDIPGRDEPEVFIKFNSAAGTVMYRDYSSSAEYDESGLVSYSYNESWVTNEYACEFIDSRPYLTVELEASTSWEEGFLPAENSLGADYFYATSLEADGDGDGLCDVDEIRIYGTDPLDADSDDDGFGDDAEIALGLSPTNDNSAIVTYILNNASDYGLCSSNAVMDVKVGEVLMAVSDGVVALNLQLEKSEDLVTWTNAGEAVEWSIPASAETGFYRVKSGKN